MQQAVILCGGRGTRLGNVLGDLPKAMAPVGDRPFLEHVLARMGAMGFDRAILATGFRRDAIHDHFGNRFGPLDIAYSVETEPLGTGGAVWQALEQARSEPCFILNGDTWSEVDYAAMAEAHRRAGGTFTMAAQRLPEIGRYGALEIADGHVTAFREKGGTGPGTINAGIYLCTPSIRDAYPMPKSFSLERDFLEAHLADLRPLAWPVDGAFIDIGVPDDLEAAQRMFAKTR
jgi:D-glycero-alpha-D-manno-heptose 1-phosphate guanylyltransferase